MVARPKEINWFWWIQLALLAFGIINAVLNWDTLSATAGADSSTFGIVLAVTTALTLLLLYFIVARRSNVARWIWIVLALLGVAMSLPALMSGTAPGGMVSALVQLAANLFSVWLLFSPPARAWFDGKTPDVDVIG